MLTGITQQRLQPVRAARNSEENYSGKLQKADLFQMQGIYPINIIINLLNIISVAARQGYNAIII
jgi:hypothetical protein